MKKAYLNYINHALKSGYKVAVLVEGEVALKSSDSYQAIKSEVEAYDAIVTLMVRDVEKKETVAWAEVLLEYNQTPEETIMDYGVNDYNEQWAKNYY